MPAALVVAFALSLGIHLSVLFGPQFGVPLGPESPPMTIELKPVPKALTEQKSAPAKVRHRQTRKKSTPVLASPASAEAAIAEAQPGPEAAAEEAVAAAPHDEAAEAPPPRGEWRLPDHGRIVYRVDRGDQEFEIGRATSEWTVKDGRYRLFFVTETNGLVWLFKAYRIEMESRGLLTEDGLQPEAFSIRRNGEDQGEKAYFDWAKREIQVGTGAPQPLDEGAQDMLSFNYQVGFMPHAHVVASLPITTGKKYTIYQLENLGDEEIKIPAGVMRTLHLRAPGTNTTELWLAYDYSLLPVKIRHSDRDGGSFVQVALSIQLSPEE